jgi:ribulose-5-phosphate 4-epimerase/fuculose-1-phosphate aldolase
MRVGRLPVLPFFAPGASGFARLAESAARDSAALLLRNHGPIAAGASLHDALEVVEEIEETAKLALLLHGRGLNPVPPRAEWRSTPETTR